MHSKKSPWQPCWLQLAPSPFCAKAAMALTFPDLLLSPGIGEQIRRSVGDFHMMHVWMSSRHLAAEMADEISATRQAWEALAPREACEICLARVSERAPCKAPPPHLVTGSRSYAAPGAVAIKAPPLTPPEATRTGPRDPRSPVWPGPAALLVRGSFPLARPRFG